MNRNRFIYFTDLMLLLVFILSFYTGVELHIAGQGVDHESWHIWAIFHTNASLLFMILGIMVLIPVIFFPEQSGMTEQMLWEAIVVPVGTDLEC